MEIVLEMLYSSRRAEEREREEWVLFVGDHARALSWKRKT